MKNGVPPSVKKIADANGWFVEKYLGRLAFKKTLGCYGRRVPVFVFIEDRGRQAPVASVRLCGEKSRLYILSGSEWWGVGGLPHVCPYDTVRSVTKKLLPTVNVSAIAEAVKGRIRFALVAAGRELRRLRREAAGARIVLRPLLPRKA